MPTLLFLRNFRIAINTQDHAPAHVHCISPDGVVLIEIETGRVIRSKGVGSKDIRDLTKLILDNKEIFMGQWRIYHD